MWSCQLAQGQAFYSSVWPGNGAQCRGGAWGLLWLDVAETLLSGSLGFAIINKIQESSEALHLLVLLGSIFVTITKER